MSRKIKRSPGHQHKTAAPAGSVLPDILFLHRQGLLVEAEEGYRHLLAQQPRHTEAMNLLAALYQQQGEFAKAIPLLQKAIAIAPTQADYHCNLGSAYRAMGDLSSALPAFQTALALNPQHLEAQFNLSASHLDLGKNEAARVGLRQLTRSRPTFLPALRLLAQTLIRLHQFDEALDTLQAITRLDSQDSAAWCEIGNLRQAEGQLTKAAAAYEQALAIHPGHAVAHNNLGNTLVKQGHIHQAMGHYQEAIRLDANLQEAHVNLSWSYKQHGMLTEDVACLRRYLARHPADSKAHSDMLFSMNYDPAYSPGELYEAACQWWQQHHPRTTDNVVPRTAAPGRALAIGFLSPDLRDHPVGTFLLPLFRALAAHPVRLHCYAELDAQEEDWLSQELQRLSHAWFRTRGLSAEEAVRAIRQDQLDILIDLAGHSANNRLDIMARQAAPIQASWLGYVNTTGLPVIHYRLTDTIADPPGAEAYYSERLLRLPKAFFCYEPPAESPPVAPLPALTAGRITFGSLNNPAKVNEEVIHLWTTLLAQTPDAQLLMVGAQFGDPMIRDRYLSLFARHGTAADRLELIPSLAKQEYLALHNRIDIGLDPFPHNGHTISCHALWMGVPVITLAGDRYSSRMGASLLTNIGLPELIAHSPEQYLALARSLAQDLPRLGELRHCLRRRLLTSPIGDSASFAEAFLQTLGAITTGPGGQK